MSLTLRNDLSWRTALREGLSDYVYVTDTAFGQLVIEKHVKGWRCIKHPLGEEYAWLNAEFRKPEDALRRATNAYYRHLAQAIKEAQL